MSVNAQRVAIASLTVVVAEGATKRQRLLAALDRGRLGWSNRAGSLDSVLDRSPVAAETAVISCRDIAEGVKAVARLRGIEGLRTVLVAPAATLADVRDAFAAGADGIVLEHELETTLVPALHAVLSGQLVLPRTLREHLAPAALSARERQVLGLVVLGFSNREVAAKLHVAEATVKSHLTTSFRKLGVRSRAEASALILDPHDGLGLGILSIAGADVSLDVFGDL